MAITAAEAGETGAWERRLNIRKRARADALAGAPMEGAQDFSAVERDVLAMVEGAVSRIETDRTALAQKLETDLRRLMPSAPDFETPIAAAKLDLRQIKGRVSAEVTTLRDRAAQARRQLDGFRQANGLGRPAIYPASSILQAGLLMLAAAFEALFSASLFAETEERGLLGGAVIALGLSGANVSLGFLSGFLGLRYLQHIKPAQKVIGTVALIAGLSMALALNLFAAAWRNQLSESSRGVLDTLDSAALFGLTSPQAVILLMLGAGIWVFSALKGYSGFDDPYPDFGKLDRAARTREEDLSQAREDARGDMEDVTDSTSEKIRSSAEAVRNALAPMRAAYDNAAARINDLDQGLRRACESGIALIHLYRRENIAARTLAAPRYFADPPPLSLHPENALARAADLLLEAQEAAANAQARAGSALEELARELETISADLDGAGA